MIKHLALVAALAGPHGCRLAAAQDQARADTRQSHDRLRRFRVQPPASLPPANSPPVVWLIVPCFEAQGNVTLIEPQTYLYYMQIQQRRAGPRKASGCRTTTASSRSMREDFTRLWNTNFLDNISIETPGLHLLQRRDRQDPHSTTWRSGSASRSSTTSGSKKFEDTKIDEKLKELGAEIRLDTFIDAALLKSRAGSSAT